MPSTKRYACKLHADGNILYEVKRDLVTCGHLQGKIALGRKRYDRPQGIIAPVTVSFTPYFELGLGELLADLPLIIKAELKFWLAVLAHKLSAKAKL